METTAESSKQEGTPQAPPPPQPPPPPAFHSSGFATRSSRKPAAAKRLRTGSGGGGGDAEGLCDGGSDEEALQLPRYEGSDATRRCNYFVKKRNAGNQSFTKKDKQTEQRAEVSERYASKRSLDLHNDQMATAATGVDAPKTEDHRAILERNVSLGQAILEGKLERGIYRGQGAYAPVTQIREGSIAAGKYTGLYGPVRGIDNVRMTMRIDYDPCICKDYKETGYCGFGDTCKFLHDRTDYKGGWQIEQEWQDEQKKKQAKLERVMKRKFGGNTEEEPQEELDSDDDSDDDDDDVNKLPFACLICRTKWTKESKPVVTECGHYFCEACAVGQYAKTVKCSECSKPTNGIFNVATRIIQKMEANPPEEEPEVQHGIPTSQSEEVGDVSR
eukprot:GHVS01031071.1.p1 GENE.GHVS01031071.1~~GHVS01031071.1.p1  ORF type:complete len:388 (-),score=70.73 GHVS01031071.1:69-1232(-)